MIESISKAHHVAHVSYQCGHVRQLGFGNYEAAQRYLKNPGELCNLCFSNKKLEESKKKS